MKKRLPFLLAGIALLMIVLAPCVYVTFVWRDLTVSIGGRRFGVRQSPCYTSLGRGGTYRHPKSVQICLGDIRIPLWRTYHPCVH